MPSTRSRSRCGARSAPTLAPPRPCFTGLPAPAGRPRSRDRRRSGQLDIKLARIPRRRHGTDERAVRSTAALRRAPEVVTVESRSSRSKKVLPRVRPAGAERRAGGVGTAVRGWPGRVGKGGVVRDPAQHQAVISRLARFSVIRGGTSSASRRRPSRAEGNREFFLHLSSHGRTAANLEGAHREERRGPRVNGSASSRGLTGEAAGGRRAGRVLRGAAAFPCRERNGSARAGVATAVVARSELPAHVDPSWSSAGRHPLSMARMVGDPSVPILGVNLGGLAS